MSVHESSFIMTFPNNLISTTAEFFYKLHHPSILIIKALLSNTKTKVLTCIFVHLLLKTIQKRSLQATYRYSYQRTSDGSPTS